MGQEPLKNGLLANLKLIGNNTPDSYQIMIEMTTICMIPLQNRLTLDFMQLIRVKYAP